ncbi:GNAT family N-acetyltransferase [Planomicrobium chinense]|uniref:GNAT family N-acetyltransferase n=1 Tax=Planococcus chinensis TaxID=272917 RepID=UPI001CC47327|nr:GNAT family N-acetyltransferase [Planococcus chinensis]MBZ5201873.1 GNAT family N-acetyltransferase [Planococcus chinensis]
MNFIRIDLETQRETLIQFRKDSFAVSFGSIEKFGDEEDYLKWVAAKSIQFPDGFILVMEDERPIGQLELTLTEYEGRIIGYVNLYYLIPDKRGCGLGRKLHEYAMGFFAKNGVKEYHLRVSPSNLAALSFYRKAGMEEIGPELDEKVIRMRGFLT